MWQDIEKPWQVAFELGWEALKNGSIPIGAVVTDENMNIISTGRNRLYEKSVKNPQIAHAETEGLINLDVSVYPKLREYTLFTCMEPCPMCMGTIVMSNIRDLRIAARDGYCGSTHFSKYDPFVGSKNINISFELGVLETIQLTLQAYFEINRQNGETNNVSSIIERENPVAFGMAKSFYNNGYLKNAIEKELPFSEVFNHIAERG